MLEVTEKISMLVRDNIIQAEGLGNFLGNFRKKSTELGEKLAINVLKNHARALENLKI